VIIDQWQWALHQCLIDSDWQYRPNWILISTTLGILLYRIIISIKIELCLFIPVPVTIQFLNLAHEI